MGSARRENWTGWAGWSGPHILRSLRAPGRFARVVRAWSVNELRYWNFP
jgi:hypothetical protein